MEPQTVQTQVQAPSWFLLVRLFYVLSETEHLRGEVEWGTVPGSPTEPPQGHKSQTAPSSD